MPPLSKGKRVKIPEPGRGYLSGDASAMGDVGESSRRECLFSLTPSADPGIGLSGDRVGWAGMDPPTSMVHIVAHFGTLKAACVFLGTPRVVDGRSRKHAEKGLPDRSR